MFLPIKSNIPMPFDTPTTSSSLSSNSKPHSSDGSNDSDNRDDSDDSNNTSTESSSDAYSNGSVTPDDFETPTQYHRAMYQLESYMTGPHGNEEKKEGRIRAKTRAFNQQQAT